MNGTQETTKPCSVCGATIPSDSKYCEVCGTKLPQTFATTIATEPDITTAKTQPELVAERPRTADETPKHRKLSMKAVLTVVVIVSVITFVLVVPWIPVVRSMVVQQEFTYSYTYPTTEVQPRKELVFSSGNVSLNAFESLAPSDYYWTSRGFLLEKGWTIQVRFNSDNYASTIIYVKSGWQGDIYFSTSSRDGSFAVARAGEFHVVLQNLDPRTGHTVSVELTAEWTEVQNMDETVTQTATLDVTKYHVTYASVIDLLLGRIEREQTALV